jgi:hypothetical protein
MKLGAKQSAEFMNWNVCVYLTIIVLLRRKDEGTMPCHRPSCRKVSSFSGLCRPATTALLSNVQLRDGWSAVNFKVVDYGGSFTGKWGKVW